ncbi:MAG: helix-hairpin-helix domain-containing protein [Bacteroidales bacterium]|nr:helix-hairpin-helix domain-containing protein [Bacteroidales bacterium]
MRIISALNSFMGFTPGERRGIAMLITSMSVLLAIRIFQPGNSYQENHQVITAEILEDTTNGSLARKVSNNHSVNLCPNVSGFAVKSIQLNHASANELILAGFPEFAARNIIKYREKGGLFSSRAELLKIYGLEEKIIEGIEQNSHLIYRNNTNTEKTAVAENKISLLELNSADTTELMRLTGIGPVLSKRIVKYRGMLGGFYSISQLAEVYGIDNDMVSRIENRLTIDSDKINRLEINQATEAILSAHPYISTYQAKAIISYRNHAGAIRNKNELLENKVLNSEDFERLSEYLKVQ